MTDTDRAPSPIDLLAELAEFKAAIVVRLEEIDAKLLELIYHQRKADGRARAAAMLRAALAAAEAPEDSDGAP